MPREVPVLAAKPGPQSLDNLYFPPWPPQAEAGFLACKQGICVQPWRVSAPGSSSRGGITPISCFDFQLGSRSLDNFPYCYPPKMPCAVRLPLSRWGFTATRVADEPGVSWSLISSCLAWGSHCCSHDHSHSCSRCWTSCPGSAAAWENQPPWGQGCTLTDQGTFHPSAWLSKEGGREAALWKQNLHCFSEITAVEVCIWTACGQLSVP